MYATEPPPLFAWAVKTKVARPDILISGIHYGS